VSHKSEAIGELFYFMFVWGGGILCEKYGELRVSHKSEAIG
jgi:hypothetical protein